MKKPLLCGIDVGSKELVVAGDAGSGRVWDGAFPNDAAGHRKRIRRLTRTKSHARVCVEATGIYHLDLCLALDQAKGIEVRVANPRTTKDFARAQAATFEDRSHGRAVSARVRAAHGLRPLVTPEPLDLEPADALKADSGPSRHEGPGEEPPACGRFGGPHPGGHPRKQLVSVKGIAQASAITLLAELSVLPPDMSTRQWVAHAGIDPRHFESGTSVNASVRISKIGNRHLRAALFLPAMVASQHEPSVRAYYETLLAKGKKPLQALDVAVMRKLLHAIHGMFEHDADFDGMKFFAEKA